MDIWIPLRSKTRKCLLFIPVMSVCGWLHHASDVAISPNPNSATGFVLSDADFQTSHTNTAYSDLCLSKPAASRFESDTPHASALHWRLCLEENSRPLNIRESVLPRTEVNRMRPFVCPKARNPSTSADGSQAKHFANVTSVSDANWWATVVEERRRSKTRKITLVRFPQKLN